MILKAISAKLKRRLHRPAYANGPAALRSKYRVFGSRAAFPDVFERQGNGRIPDIA